MVEDYLTQQNTFSLPYTPEFEFIEDQARAEEVLQFLLKEPILAVDTETTGLDPFTSKILLYQVATEHKCYILNCLKVDPKVWNPILTSKNILKLLQNAKFDYKMLKVHTGASTFPVYDTMLAEQLLTAGLLSSASLKNLILKYLGIEISKDIRKSFINHNGNFTRNELLYAANDGLTLFPIYEKQLELLKRENLLNVASLEFNTVIPYAEMELAGFKIDSKKWRSLLDKATVLRKEVENNIQDSLKSTCSQLTILGESTINLGSQKQLMYHLKKFGLRLENTEEKTLAELSREHPIADKLLIWRKWSKIVTSYGESLLEKINPVTNRLHATFNQIITTGRSSCRDPNLQQIPSDTFLDFRSCFVATPGYKIIGCDYCLAPETRVLTEDLRWVTIESVEVGDKLIGVEEYASKQVRYLKSTIVERKKTLVQPCYRLTLDDGSQVVSSSKHRWLVKVKGTYRWLETNSLKVESEIAKFLDPWKVENSWEEGYLAGVSDGEDSLYYNNQRNKGSSIVWEGRELRRGVKSVKKIEYLGEQEVIGIQTSERTFIAEGLVSHNSQQELRILAELSNDKGFIESFVNDEDIHAKAAAGIFKIPLPELLELIEAGDKEAKKKRSTAKMINFAISYGATAYRISRELKISEEEAQGIIDGYFESFPGVRKYLYKYSNMAIQNSFVSTVLGRKRYFNLPSIDDEKYKRDISSIKRRATNAPVQAGAADVTKLAVCNFYYGLKEKQWDARLLLVVHDELVCEAKEDIVEEVAKFLEESMLEAYSTIYKTVPMKVDAIISDYWSKG